MTGRTAGRARFGEDTYPTKPELAPAPGDAFLAWRSLSELDGDGKIERRLVGIPGDEQAQQGFGIAAGPGGAVVVGSYRGQIQPTVGESAVSPPVTPTSGWTHDLFVARHLGSASSPVHAFSWFGTSTKPGDPSVTASFFQSGDAAARGESAVFVGGTYAASFEYRGAVVGRPVCSGCDRMGFLLAVDEALGDMSWWLAVRGDSEDADVEAVATEGNALVFGGSVRGSGAIVDPTTLDITSLTTTSLGANCYVAKIDAAGGPGGGVAPAVTWARAFGSNGLDSIASVATRGGLTAIGGVYGGLLALPTQDGTLPPLEAPPDGQLGAFAALLDEQGFARWAVRLAAGTTGGGTDAYYPIPYVAFDDAGDVLVAGSADGVLWVDGMGASTGDYDAYAAKLSAADGAPMWTKHFPGVEAQHVTGLAFAAAPESRMLVAGYFRGSLKVDTSSSIPASGADGFLLVLDPRSPGQ